jgi:Tol biopolymer transport system component
MTYYYRIAAFSLLLALLTALLLWWGPVARAVTVVTQTPTGETVSVGAPIRIIFSQPVDRLSVEERFMLTPETSGRFLWEGQTVTFQPDQPLRPATTYQVTLQPGIADQAARSTTQEAIGWTFRTRSPRLLLRRHAADGAGILLLADADGSKERELLREPAGIEDMTIAPDGSHALITVPRSAERSALMLVNLDDGSTRPLVDSPDVSASTAAWSPDGNLIAFEQRTVQDDIIGDPVIWLAQPDGTSFGPVTEGEQVGIAPVWSPDGSRLAFAETTSQTVAIYAFTSAFQTFPDSSGEPVTWSPDSAALIYTSSTGKLWRADLASGQRVSLSPQQGGSAETPAWSPDGAWVALVRQENPTAAATLWLMRPDGSDRKPLHHPGDASESQPSWSPDSQHLAFLRTGSDGTSAAWVFDRASGEQYQVAQDVAQVVWVP